MHTDTHALKHLSPGQLLIIGCITDGLLAAGCDMVALSFRIAIPEADMHLKLSVTLKKILNWLCGFSFFFFLLYFCANVKKKKLMTDPLSRFL